MSRLFKKEIMIEGHGKCELYVMIVNNQYYGPSSKYFALNIPNVGNFVSINRDYENFCIRNDSISIYDSLRYLRSENISKIKWHDEDAIEFTFVVEYREKNHIQIQMFTPMLQLIESFKNGIKTNKKYNIDI